MRLALGLATSDLGALSLEVLERFDLTHTQYNVLRMLAGAGERGLTHAQITEWLITEVPDVTRLVDRLGKRGVVRRRRDPSDRRKVVLAPSIFVYGAAFTHVQDYLTTGNEAPLNWSFTAVGANLLIPTLVLTLTWIHARHGGFEPSLPPSLDE